MLLPDNSHENPDKAGSAAILAKLDEALAELDALGCHLAAAHVSMAIHALAKSDND